MSLSQFLSRLGSIEDLCRSIVQSMVIDNDPGAPTPSNTSGINEDPSKKGKVRERKVRPFSPHFSI